MFWSLVKKELTSVFRSYFVDIKKNEKKSAASVVGGFVLFGLLMIGILGTMFTILSATLCEGLSEAGVKGLYFLIMALLGIMLGTFGTVFNTYAALYKAQDNDLLLSLPIKTSEIIGSRIMNVVIMDMLYSCIVTIPAVGVNIFYYGFSMKYVLGGLAYILLVVLIVLVLSLVLGYGLAIVSNKLTNSSYIKVLAALVFLGLYYFFYFKAQNLLNEILLNAAVYGGAIKGKAAILYALGEVGEGKLLPAVSYLGAFLLLTAACIAVISRNFLELSSSKESIKARKLKDSDISTGSVLGGLVRKELAHFTSSSNYMLNCGLGIVFMAAAAVALVIKADFVKDVLLSLNFTYDDMCLVIGFAICMMITMVDIAAPSISLEGKSLWIVKSLPVSSVKIIMSKVLAQLVVVLPLTVVTGLISAVIFNAGILSRLFAVLMPSCFAVFFALICIIANLLFHNFNWTNEIFPIKQGASVMIALLGGMVFVMGFGALYLAVLTGKVSPSLFAGLSTLAFALASMLMILWIKGRGSRIIDEL